ncbi:conserved exported protein of unknown function [Maridesulfovibrio hydrothermalis AM13 = DSM 14728]|uniref:Rhodanese domain-containing protein n=2 Tax=Maridesulfovibrio TaxID=2794998 RepID=L0R619_9BACT|nr:rhodanese-like domain-containing protein [Maridesulfovibrio hydrothermalis]CCO22124.1 conserved exported protein of unknown function [Maridesulfovibrio hydrothermalis AM13 = DSM 14728]
MNRRILLILVAAIFATVASFAVFQEAGSAEDVPRISIEQLKRKLGSDNLVIIDARSGSDWRGSEFMIEGAVRGKAGQEKQWAKNLHKDAEIVVYCA